MSTAMSEAAQTAPPDAVPPPPGSPPGTPESGGIDAARLAALEALVAQLAAEAAPAVTVLADPSQPLGQRLLSRKLWITVAAVLLTLSTWLSGHLSGQYASVVIAVVTVAYVAVQGYLDATQVKAASGVRR